MASELNARLANAVLKINPGPDSGEGTIVIAFDPDEAGKQAALDAIDKYYNLIFGAEDEDKSHNGTWTREAEAYNLFLDEIFSMGLNGYLRRNGEIHDSQVRKWPLKRLLKALDTWDRLIFSMLFYGNSYLIEYYLPKSKERRQAVEKELIRRASPKRKAIVPASNPGEWLSADYVRQTANFQHVYEYYLTNTKLTGKELTAMCPFEQGKQNRPAFSANIETGLYKCFRCHETGNAFQLVMRIEKVEFPTALRKVAELGGLTNV